VSSVRREPAPSSRWTTFADAGRLCFQRSVLFAILMFTAIPAKANELSVDRSTVQMDETVTIVVSLDGEFATADSLTVPVRNLVINGQPSVSSQYALTDTGSSRHKIFRFVAQPLAPGAALVGPLVVVDGKGHSETLPPVPVQILPEAGGGSNDPLTILRALRVARRDPVFVIVTTDHDNVLPGEPVIVTWTIFSATSVQRLQISDLPKLGDFWIEELDVRNEHPEQTLVGDDVVARLLIRRAVLYPVRSGTLLIPPLSISAGVMHQLSDGFGGYEGELAVITRRSTPLTLTVRPMPAGPPVDVVGDVTIRCSKPVQRSGGPVTFDAVLSGRANLRAAPSPRMGQGLAGTLQVGEAGLTVEPHETGTMTRRWRYLIFPEAAGSITIPSVSTRILLPSGERKEIRCEAVSLAVSSASVPDARGSAAAARPSANTRRSLLPWLAGGAALVLLLLIAIPRWRRARQLRSSTRSLIGGRSPAVVREAVDAMLSSRGISPLTLFEQSSESGDAYRALRSLLDAMERQRLNVSELEIEDRVRELLQSLR
jgi:hypothetical protein